MDFSFDRSPADTISQPPADAATPAARLLERVGDAAFPCVGAKAALARGAIRTLALGPLGCPRDDARLLDAIADFAGFVEARPDGDTTVHSLAVVFAGPARTDEARFEALLGAQLQRLHDLDRARGQAWAEGVSTDPDDARFSLSLAGHPFFVIGLHAGASRLARRFETPVLVFNSHLQFDALRADGRYPPLHARVAGRAHAVLDALYGDHAHRATADTMLVASVIP